MRETQREKQREKVCVFTCACVRRREMYVVCVSVRACVCCIDVVGRCGMSRYPLCAMHEGLGSSLGRDGQRLFNCICLQAHTCCLWIYSLSNVCQYLSAPVQVWFSCRASSQILCVLGATHTQTHKLFLSLFLSLSLDRI